MFHMYHVNNDFEINNIDHSEATAWGVRKGFSLGFGVAAVGATIVSLFEIGPLAEAATFITSLVSDIASAKLEKKNVWISTSPETAGAATWSASKAVNYTEKSLNLPNRVASKGLMGVVSSYLGIKNLVSEIKELFK